MAIAGEASKAGKEMARLAQAMEQARKKVGGWSRSHGRTCIQACGAACAVSVAADVL